MKDHIREFGKTAGGRRVEAVTIASANLRATILTYGATLQDIRLAGTPWPLTLGGQDLAACEGPMRCFGAIVGPVANRIGKARAVLDGKPLRFEANEQGRTSLHGGYSGLSQQIWTIRDVTGDSVVLGLALPDGLGGYPGNRDFAVTFRLENGTLGIDMSATTDAPTLINLANHSYWNLDGGADTSGHVLTVAADRYTPVDADLIPDGPPQDVTGTAFDLRQGRTLDDVSRYDHNFCTADGDQPLRQVALLQGVRGVTLRMDSTAPGLQIYDGARMTTGTALGHTGQPYGPFGGIALETQGWPDAPNRPDFPSVRAGPGQSYSQGMSLTFTRSTAS